MSFPRLLEVALAGTLRQEPPPVLAGQEALSAERRLLRGASYEGMRRLAGRPVERAQGGVPIEPAQSELFAEIPPAAAVRLAEILETRPELLREWLRLAVGRNLRVPPLSVPDLLEHARTESDTELRELIVVVGAQRMAWLAGLNPEWRFAAYADPEQQLTLGLPDERAAALRRIRRQNPARGRELMHELWAAERGDARQKLLDALVIGLSDADEPFLEQAIRDARREVRGTALRLIRRIPNSRFGQRWSERARQIFTLKGARLEIREPAAEAAPEWVADGLDPRPPKGIGATAWLLQQILALTPPSVWPRTALAAIGHSDWPMPLLTGIAEAARAYGDAAWSEDLLRLWAGAANREEKLPFDPGDLYGILGTQCAETVLRRVLELNPMLVEKLIGVRSDPWSMDLSRFVIQQLASWYTKQRYPLTFFVRDAELLCDPRVLPEAERMLDTEMKSIYATGVVDRLVDTLDYRLAMRQELAK